MNPDQLLNELGLAIGLPHLRFNEEGCAKLVFDDQTAVNLENDRETGQIQLYTGLCPLPPEGRESLYLALLEGNLFGTHTLGATLAVDSAHHEVVLCRTVVAQDLSASAFTEIIEAFVNTAEQWRETLASNPTAVDAPAPRLEPMGGPSSGFIRG